MRNALLIVGSIAFDTIETPAGGVEKALGGSAVYASLAARRFVRPCVVGVVGDDFGAERLEVLSDRGIDTRGIEHARGDTFHWKGRYHENMKDRDTLSTCLNVFENFNPKIPDDYRKCRYVFLGNIDPVLQARVLDQVGETALVGLDTMNFWIKSSPDALRAVMKRIDVLFINDEEAIELSGERSILRASETILGLGPRYLVVKQGEYGALLFGEGACLSVPGILLPGVVDPTGAGDAFAGGFCGYAASQEAADRRTLARALLAGTVMASFTVEGFSVDNLLHLSERQLTGRFSQLEAMMRY
ncbi:MAG: sugar kinase [Chitinivibrionia bacterium]|nr:sugar kinase [Chitinivibrionia bacterium]